jgi:hypothetical protein
MFRFAFVEGSSRPLFASALALALSAAGALAVTQSAAAAAEGFALLAGSWSGTGTVTTSNGSSERLRCRIDYAVTASGNGMHQDMRCASDSYNFQVSSDIASQGGALSGTWSELTRQVSGNVSGRMSGGAIQVAVSGPAFSAGLSISTSGNRQSVTIRPSGGDISNVSLNLMRSGR